MKIEVNLNKKYSLIGALIAVVLIFGIVNVIAYTKSVGTVPNPGHALSSVQGYFSGDSNLESSLDKFCQSDGTNCAAGGVTVNTEVKGSIVGGGVTYGPELSITKTASGAVTISGTGVFTHPTSFSYCRNTNLWGGAVCSQPNANSGLGSGNVVCPVGSQFRIVGVHTTTTADGLNYFYYFICVKN